LCDRLGKVLGTISQMSPVGEILKSDHNELVFMLQDLAAIIDPRECITRHRGEELDVELVGDTAAVAEVTAQHAQILTKKVH
jgi:hypothetical protein